MPPYDAGLSHSSVRPLSTLFVSSLVSHTVPCVSACCHLSVLSAQESAGPKPCPRRSVKPPVETAVETPWTISGRHAAAKPREMIRRVFVCVFVALSADRAGDPAILPFRPCVVLCLCSPS